VKISGRLTRSASGKIF